jgi:hypothetical protein
MSNNLKPLFRDDIARTMLSVYFSSIISRPRKQSSDDYRAGFAAAISSVAIAVGINPETILENEDLGLLRDFAGRQ